MFDVCEVDTHQYLFIIDNLVIINEPIEKRRKIILAIFH
jgi:hypothetical protein